MRRRWILAIVVTTALIFALVGTAFGYYVLAQPEGESGQCILFRATLERGTGANQDTTVKAYDQFCR